VSRITPCGKYLVFFSRKGRAALADRFGAPFVSALGDVCETAPFAREDLAALAAQQLNTLAAKVKARLGLTLAAGADVRDYVADQCSPQQGVAGLTACCDRMFRALSEYCLQTDAALTGTVSLTAREGGIEPKTYSFTGPRPTRLFSSFLISSTAPCRRGPHRQRLERLRGPSPPREGGRRGSRSPSGQGHRGAKEVVFSWGSLQILRMAPF